MRLLVFLALPILLWSQNPKAPVYPGGTVADKDLGVQVNLYQSTLAGDITGASITVSLSSTAGLRAFTYLGIDSEYMMVCQVVDGSTVRIGKSSCPNVDGRGMDGTFAAAHASNGATTKVAAYLVAGQFNQLAAEVKSIESTPLQSATFLAAGTGAVPRTLTSKVQEVISVMDYGAKGDGAQDDTAAFAKAFAAACASNGPRVVFPTPPNRYIISTTIQLCDQIDVAGTGHPIISYNGTGPLFNMPGNINMPSIHGFELLGNKTAGQIGIRVQGNGGIVVQGHFYDLIIYNFGDVATHTGAGIEIDGNGAISLSITNVDMACDGDDIFINNAPTDSLNVSDNTLGGSGYCVRVEGGSGAGTVRVSHNNLTCVKGAIRYNPLDGAAIVDSNEFEATGTVNDINGAPYSFLAGTSYIANNLSTTHGFAVYDYYAGNGVSFTKFYGNQGGGATSGVFFVGTGSQNSYWNNTTVGSPLYSNPAYSGILPAPVSGIPSGATFWRGDGAWGTAASSLTPANNAVCNPGQLWFDTGFLYVCAASGSVKRVALTAF